MQLTSERKLSERFSVSSNIVLRSEPQYYNTYAAYDYRQVSTEFLTKEEFAALKYISSRSAAIDEISKEAEVKRDQCQKFLKRMLRLGYVQKNVAPSGIRTAERVDVSPTLYENFPLPFLSAPTSVDVFITSRCNLNCVHCFSDSEMANPSDLSMEQLRSTFNQLEKLGVFEVRINGGEPFLHPRIEEILALLREKRFRRVILTNGTVLDSRTIRLLQESDTTPTVSLDDSEAEGHDLFRGVKGSFSRTIEALRLLQDSKIQYGINCCLHRRNLRRFRNIIDLAVKCGASRIAFLDLKAAGRMRNHMEWIPSNEEYQEAMLDLMMAKVRYGRKIDVALDTFLHCDPLKESAQEAKRGYVSCQAGKARLTVDSDGSIYPCNLVISDPKWIMGNINNDTILDVWFSPKWLFFRGGVKTSDLIECGKCKNLAKCKDFFCRLLPYLADGNPLGPHPNCKTQTA